MNTDVYILIEHFSEQRNGYQTCISLSTWPDDINPSCENGANQLCIAF
jgi:hypothetical protein